MDDGLKQRLVGAIVLLAIAVLFLPSLFSQSGRRTVDMSTQIPAEPPVVAELMAVPEPEPVEDIPPAKALADNYPHTPIEEAPAQAAQNEGPEPADPAVAEEPVAEAPALNAEGVPEAWSLQVASFRSAERAKALQEQLQAAGHKAYVRQASAGESSVHRVFVGPKISKAMAEAEKRGIDERFKTDALIVEFKP